MQKNTAKKLSPVSKVDSKKANDLQTTARVDTKKSFQQ